MLYRSIYFLFHDERSVREVISRLEQHFGLGDKQLHAIIESGHRMTELPGTTLHRKSPEVLRRERNVLYLSVAVFTLSLSALVLSLLAGAWYLSVLFAILVVGGQLSGYLLGSRIPNAQLDRFRTGLSQGAILLQVDIPPGQVREIKKYVGEFNPESQTGISNWHVGSLGT